MLPPDQDIDPRLRPRIDAAWAVIEENIDGLPPTLKAAALDFLARRRPGRDHHDYFSDLAAAAPVGYLPLWLEEGLGLAHDPALLQATMWGYFAIRIQDDAIDEARPVAADQLFANVCLERMNHGLRQVAVPGFWPIFDALWTQFSDQTLAEHLQLRSGGDYGSELFEEHASKVAFAAVPLVLLCLRAGKPERIDAACALVHELGIGLGLVNDVRGYARDVANGHRTHLLATAGWVHGQPLDDALRTRLYDEGVINGFDERTAESLKRARALADDVGMGPAVGAWLDRVDGVLSQASAQRFTLRLLKALSAPG